MSPSERDLRALDDLIGIGLNLARAVERHALGQAAPEEAAALAGVDPGLAFSRLSRAVRLTVALKSKLAEDRRGPAIEAAKQRRCKRQITEAVETLIETAAEEIGERCDHESLHADLRERLDDAEIEEEIASYGVGRILVRICRDLGIAPRWELWRDTSWYHDERCWRLAESGDADAAEEVDEDETEDADETEADEPGSGAARQRRIIGRIDDS